MRVVIVSKTFVFDAAQRQLEWLARQPDIELTLISPDQWQSDDGRLLRFVPRFVEGYAVRTLPLRFNGRYHLFLYRGLSHVIRAIAPDIVHIDEEPYNPAGIQAQRAAETAGARSVFTVLQNLYKQYPPPYSFIERYNLRHTAHMIACNADAARVVRRKGYDGPLSTFAVYGVDPDLYAPVGVARARTALVVGYIGRLVLYKGLGVLIEALAGLPEYVQLRLVGSGPDESKLRELVAQHGLVHRVEFVPPVDASQIPKILAGMDVLVLPSLTQSNWMEQFGRVLIEAMSCEVPVIGSRSGEIPNVIGDAGLVVPEGDVEALRQALRQLATNESLRAGYARAGRQRVLAEFTQERVAAKLMTVYATVLAGNPKVIL